MPELRKDPVLSRWVIISTERAKRPHDYKKEEEPKRGGKCPFCPGNEQMTPPEIMAYREENTQPNGPGWFLRVVPNMFPALMVEGELIREGEGIYDKMTGVGAHEVIIETPNHLDTLSTIDTGQFENVIWAYKERISDLKRDDRLKYVLVFKNHGYRAGASLEHAHSQLIALPIVPKTVMEELNGSKDYYNYKERCIFCDIIKQEMREGVRVVAENTEFLVICPFAARFPFEMWIMPKQHQSSFEDIEMAEVASLAQIFSNVLRRLRVGLDDPAYNFFLHNSPFTDSKFSHYHWHFEIVPRITRMAGFERGTGFYINPTPPEDSAKFLRDLELG